MQKYADKCITIQKHTERHMQINPEQCRNINADDCRTIRDMQTRCGESTDANADTTNTNSEECRTHAEHVDKSRKRFQNNAEYMQNTIQKNAEHMQKRLQKTTCRNMQTHAEQVQKNAG